MEKSFEFSFSDEIILDSSQALLASTEKADTFNVVAFGITWEQCDCIDDCSCQTDMNTANTGVSSTVDANSALDGTGAIATFIAAPSGVNVGGTKIETIHIKGIGTTSQGMVRIFVQDNSGGKFLFTEVPIPANVQTDIEPAFRGMVVFPVYLPPGYSLGASTETGDTFNVMSFGRDVLNCSC